MPIPTVATPRSEQQKIADCLDSLDDLIADVRDGSSKTLRQHKQGLIQQLFPQARRERCPGTVSGEFRNRWRRGRRRQNTGEPRSFSFLTHR